LAGHVAQMKATRDAYRSLLQRHLKIGKEKYVYNIHLIDVWVKGTSLGSCPTAEFGVSSVKPWCYSSKILAS
jgi:hypothetical protein